MFLKMESVSNYTPLDDELLLPDEPVNAASTGGFFDDKRMLFFTIGAFALVSVLVIAITLLMRIRDNAAQTEASSGDMTKVSAELDANGSLDVLGKPSNTPTTSLTRPPSKTPTITKTPTLTPKVTSTLTLTPTQTPTNTPIPTLLPTATYTPTPTASPTSTPTITPTPTNAPPGPPTGLTLTPGTGDMGLVWTAPVFTGGTAITDYVIEYKLSSDPDSAWIIYNDGVGTSTSVTVAPSPALTGGISYDFKVAAVNAVGQGLFSSKAIGTPN
ncbi:MAG: fibronectin type III domain-containing protein [Patescibacteria group bacterium]